MAVRLAEDRHDTAASPAGSCRPPQFSVAPWLMRVAFRAPPWCVPVLDADARQRRPIACAADRTGHPEAAAAIRSSIAQRRNVVVGAANALERGSVPGPGPATEAAGPDLASGWRPWRQLCSRRGNCGGSGGWRSLRWLLWLMRGTPGLGVTVAASPHSMAARPTRSGLIIPYQAAVALHCGGPSPSRPPCPTAAGQIRASGARRIWALAASARSPGR